VIDPERELIEFLHVWLEPERCQVEGCLSGREGREMARRTRPDLIILELLLPDMDGLELCRQLHAEETLRERPILVLTQLDTGQVRLQAQEAGASLVMAKPFSFLTLLPAIEFLTHRIPPGKGFAYPPTDGFQEHVLRPRHVPSWLRPLPTQFDTFPCPFCSAELRSGDNFCLTCGKWLPSGA
jgi:DNA-binding response OmpR family regulator